MFGVIVLVFAALLRVLPDRPPAAVMPDLAVC